MFPSGIVVHSHLDAQRAAADCQIRKREITRGRPAVKKGFPSPDVVHSFNREARSSIQLVFLAGCQGRLLAGCGSLSARDLSSGCDGGPASGKCGALELLPCTQAEPAADHRRKC